MKSPASLLVLATVLAASCAHGAGSGPLVLRLPDSGKLVRLAARQTVTVRLAWNPSTGYRWETAAAPDARVLIVENSGYDQPPAKKPGAPGEAWWQLRATGAGWTSIAWRYVRPWEPGEKAQEFRLIVNVGMPDLAHWTPRFRL